MLNASINNTIIKGRYNKQHTIKQSLIKSFAIFHHQYFNKFFFKFFFKNCKFLKEENCHFLIVCLVIGSFV